METKHLKIIRWSIRIIALVIMLLGLPYYLGYGNPLPFIKPGYGFLDNLWLTIFPLVFIGFGLGWKYEKIGGYLVTIPLSIGLLLGLIVEKELMWFMLFPLLLGILYLILGYRNKVNLLMNKSFFLFFRNKVNLLMNKSFFLFFWKLKEKLKTWRYLIALVVLIILSRLWLVTYNNVLRNVIGVLLILLIAFLLAQLMNKKWGTLIIAFLSGVGAVMLMGQLGTPGAGVGDVLLLMIIVLSVAVCWFSIVRSIKLNKSN